MQKVIDRLNAWAHWKRIEINSMRNSVTPYKNMDAVDDEESFLNDIEVVTQAAIDSIEDALTNAKLRQKVFKLETALKRIYTYRSDKPDWNMVMAIAEDAIAPKRIVFCESNEEDR